MWLPSMQMGTCVRTERVMYNSVQAILIPVSAFLMSILKPMP